MELFEKQKKDEKTELGRRERLQKRASAAEEPSKPASSGGASSSSSCRTINADDMSYRPIYADLLEMPDDERCPVPSRSMASAVSEGVHHNGRPARVVPDFSGSAFSSIGSSGHKVDGPSVTPSFRGPTRGAESSQVIRARMTSE